MSYLEKSGEGGAETAEFDQPPVTATTSSIASHQHQQEQEMLSGYTIPNPPASTRQSSAADYDNDLTDVGERNEAPRTLWMGDLDPWLDEAGIQDLWWKILKKKVSAKIFKPKNLKSEMNYKGLTHSGYCFVEFDTFDDAQQALGLNGQLLPDIAMPSQQQFPNNPDNQKKYFRLNWASGATLSAPIVQTPEYSLFVGDLSASTTEAHLLAFFQKSFPTSIKTVRVMTDPVSGKSRCFGFVRFTDELERQRALVEMDGAWFGGRPLRVALATPRNSKPKYPSLGVHFFLPDQSHQMDLLYLPHPPPTLGSPYGFYGNPQIPFPVGIPPSDILGDGNLDARSQMRSPNVPPMRGQPFVDPNNTTVFVGGLSSEVSEQTLFTLFKPFGIIQQIKIPPGKNCGFIKYNTRGQAEEAIASMQGFIIGGNRVRLSWGRVSANNRRYHQQQQQQAAQAAHLQAAAALSMGLDPSLAAGGYPTPLPGQLGAIPPMSMPPMMPPSSGSPSNEREFAGAPGEVPFDNEGNPIAPPYYMPMPPADFVSSPDQLASAVGNMQLDDRSSPNDEKGPPSAPLPRPDNYVSPGMFVPPMFNGQLPPDLRYPFVPPVQPLPEQPEEKEEEKTEEEK